jgi:hypothetical protein
LAVGDKMKLSKKEIEYLVTLIKVDMGIISFLNGFKKPIYEDIKKKNFCDTLIRKLNE